MEPVSASILAGGALATGGLNLFSGSQTNRANVEATEKANAANYQLWKENIYQENHAIRRRKEDLVAAGFSPVLAAGQGASSPSPIKMEASHEENYAGAAIGNAIQSALAQTQISKTEMDNRRTASEIGKIAAETTNTLQNTEATRQNMRIQNIMTSYQTKAISAQTMRTQIQAAKDEYERDISAMDKQKYEFTGVNHRNADALSKFGAEITGKFRGHNENQSDW